MAQASTSIEEQIRAALALYEEQSKHRIEEQIRAAVAQNEEQAKPRVEEQIRAAVAQHEEQIRATVAQYEEQAKPRVEKQIQAAVAEANKVEDAGPRNLVICIDGTANQFGVKVCLVVGHFSRDLVLTVPSCPPQNSNVVELYHLLVKDESQITFYNSGIGTYAKPSWRSWSYYKQVVGHTIDLMIAWCVSSSWPTHRHPN